MPPDGWAYVLPTFNNPQPRWNLAAEAERQHPGWRLVRPKTMTSGLWREVDMREISTGRTATQQLIF